MKESIFNIYHKTNDGIRLAFNGVGCGLAVIDETYDELISILSTIQKESDIPAHLKDVYFAAKEGKYIVDDDCDEIAELQLKRHALQYSNDILALTIAPTLECNFRCVYCYETPKKGFMSENVQQAIVDFLEKRIKDIKKFDVTWYGGEPLVAQNIVCDLSEKFVELCEKNNVEYKAYMVSNASLLDSEIIEKFKQYKISGIQITLDGMKEIHDKRRVSKDGISKFDKIVDNINKLLSVGVDVAIRVNVDKNNASEIESLISYLSKILVTKKVKFGFGQVMSCTNACKNIESTCYNTKEFAQEMFGYYRLLIKYGFAEANPYPYPTFKVTYCMSDLVNSFVVDPEGYLYKCWNNVGDIDTAVGNICDKEFDVLSSKQAKWILRNPISREECRKCKLLPICMGGCPHKSVMEKLDETCDYTKYLIDEMMLVQTKGGR